MEVKGTTFNRPSHDEVKEMFRRAKARQQQLEEEGRRMWEEDFFAKIFHFLGLKKPLNSTVLSGMSEFPTYLKPFGHRGLRHVK